MVSPLVTQLSICLSSHLDPDLHVAKVHATPSSLCFLSTSLLSGRRYSTFILYKNTIWYGTGSFYWRMVLETELGELFITGVSLSGPLNRQSWEMGVCIPTHT